MKKKGSSALKILLTLKILLYSFIILGFIAVACSIVSHFVGNVTKYWLNFISENYMSISFFLMVVLSAAITFDSTGKQKVIGIIATIGIALIGGMIFKDLALPLDRDLYVMITKSYSEVNGSVVKCNEKRSKKGTDTELIIHDKIKNQNITVTFLDQSSASVFKVGDNIKVKYLPNSHMGITYSNSQKAAIEQ